MIAHAPVRFVKMASGRVIPIQPSSAELRKQKRFLIVLQFYAGDRDAAEQLASLIADLERTRNHEADILLFRRADSPELSPQIVAKLQSKFDRVLVQACRRTDAKGYPMGPNQMWSDLLMLMSQVVPYRNDYYAFVNLETDVTPTGPGWIPTIIAAWKSAMAEGKPIIGHFCTDPFVHLNGMAVYSADVYRRAGGNVLAGGSPQVCFDIRHHPTLFPMAKESPVIFFKYRQATITPDELFAVRRGGVAPALYHGVKDGSARAAVRARHISFTDKLAPLVFIQPAVPDPAPAIAVTSVSDPESFSCVEPDNFGVPFPNLVHAQDLASIVKGEVKTQLAATMATEPVKRPNVYTYYQGRGRVSAETTAILEAWRKGWATRGWNPIVLTLRDAAKHPRFDDMAGAVEKLPYVGDRSKMGASFNRWLALDCAGGGLMVDSNVFPSELIPAGVSEQSPMVFVGEAKDLLGVNLIGADARAWVESMERYDAQPADAVNGKAHVADSTIAFATFRNDSVVEAGLVRVVATNPERTSVAMERFLGGATA